MDNDRFHAVMQDQIQIFHEEKGHVISSILTEKLNSIETLTADEKKAIASILFSIIEHTTIASVLATTATLHKMGLISLD